MEDTTKITAESLEEEDIIEIIDDFESRGIAASHSFSRRNTQFQTDSIDAWRLPDTDVEVWRAEMYEEKYFGACRAGTYKSYRAVDVYRLLSDYDLFYPFPPREPEDHLHIVMSTLGTDVIKSASPDYPDPVILFDVTGHLNADASVYYHGGTYNDSYYECSADAQAVIDAEYDAARDENGDHITYLAHGDTGYWHKIVPVNWGLADE